jgi:GcrA cell cycle regulator
MPPAPWPEEKVDELRALRTQNLSASQIARLMLITRNAVIGKMRRLGISNPNSKILQAKRNNKKTFEAKRSNKPPAQTLLTVFLTTPLPESIMPEALGAPEAILALRSNQCSWPIGDPLEQNFYFCSAPRAPARSPLEASSSYCSWHSELAKAPARRKYG